MSANPATNPKKLKFEKIVEDTVKKVNQQNPVIVINNNKKPKPKFEGKKKQPKRGKLQGIPTEEQKWRMYDNYIKPQINLKAEMEGDTDIVKSIKEALGIPFKAKENISNVETSPFEDPISRNTLKNELFDVGTKLANDVIANDNYQRQLKEDRSAIQVLKMLKGNNIKQKFLRAQYNLSKVNPVMRKSSYLESTDDPRQPININMSPEKSRKYNQSLKERDALRRSERNKQYLVPQDLPKSAGRPKSQSKSLLAGGLMVSPQALQGAKKTLKGKAFNATPIKLPF